MTDTLQLSLKKIRVVQNFDFIKLSAALRCGLPKGFINHSFPDIYNL